MARCRRWSRDSRSRVAHDLAARRRRWHAPILRHLREVDERLVVAGGERVLDLLVEPAARALRERDAQALVVAARALDVLGEARFGRIAGRIALREQLLQKSEAVVTSQHGASRVAAVREQMLAEAVEVVTVVGDVLARVIAVALDEASHLRLLAPIDAFDERDAELAVVDAPDLHAAVGIVGAHVVDAIDQRAAFDLDVEPRPLLDRAFRAGVGDVIDFPEVRHDPLHRFSLSGSRSRRRGRRLPPTRWPARARAGRVTDAAYRASYRRKLRRRRHRRPRMPSRPL